MCLPATSITSAPGGMAASAPMAVMFPSVKTIVPEGISGPLTGWMVAPFNAIGRGCGGAGILSEAEITPTRPTQSRAVLIFFILNTGVLVGSVPIESAQLFRAHPLFTRWFVFVLLGLLVFRIRVFALPEIFHS